MKDFAKYVLATIVGIFATMIISGILMLMSVVGMIASGEATQSTPKNSVMVLNLSGIIDEQGQENVFGKLTGGAVNQIGLNDVLTAIKKAKDNDNIKGIYIEAGALQTGYATALEIRQALADFKKSKKFIVSYADNYTQGAYYIASVADKVYMNPSGMVDLHGVGAQTMFVKDLFAKFGIHYQIIKVGKFKSATEMYSEDKMSDANREQMTVYVNGLWDNIVKSISKSRKISVDDLNTMTDNLTMMLSPEEAKSKKLVDGLLYTDEVKSEVKKLLKLDEKESISQLGVAQMKNAREKKSRGGEQIAVYYAAGEIVDSPVTGIMNMGSSQIVGNTMSSDLEDLMNDDDVKAVVLRVNSPGGSAYASEQIWHMVTKLKAKKPVVVSMGDYAASGGYYISCNANWIVAQPTTLTGSIGIFGVIPEGSDLFKNKLGLKFDEVKTNKHTTMASSVYGFMSRPFDAEETELMQQYINRGYSLFRKRVADGRKQSVETIEEIAQGRVWLGQDAIGLKLVDQLGNLDDAIAKAAKLAKLDEYYTEEYPAPGDFMDQLLASTEEGSGTYLDDKVRVLLGDWYMPFVTMKAATEQTPIRASMPYMITIK